jgi:uncharacterized protein (DUF4415 family)
VRDDPDLPPPVDRDWLAPATLMVPQPKNRSASDSTADTLEHFSRYPRYQTRINAILEAAIEHAKKTG